ncbi:MAG: hypothetical protein NWF07_10140 [Candidatus Bathyarchaeota archaeon]|nr:hypothetical protein [Candidatus Bathyarchaeota archaeon]
MEYSELPDTRISGSGRVSLPGFGTLKISGSGRVYIDSISTSGSSTIPGGLRLHDLKTSGSTKIDGDISSDTIKFSGSAHIEGALECEELIKSGSIKIGKSLKADYARLSGSTHVRDGGVIGREIETSGSIEFGDDLVSEDRIMYSGVMRVDGRVQAKSFEARLSRDESYIRDGITSDYINILRSHEDWRNMGSLVTSDIIGDDITLENVQCENVRGKKIVIKKGCYIKGTVEYSDTIQVDPASSLRSEPIKTE